MPNNLPAGETKEEYEKDTEKYFGHREGPKILGPSADDASSYSQHLPGKKQEHDLAQRYATGFDKTARSGAQSQPNAGPAIFPNSLKFASEFIDEMTPGKYKSGPKAFQSVAPVDQNKINNGPKLACIIVDLCMDCMQPIDHQSKETKNIYTKCPDCGKLVKFLAEGGRNIVINYGGMLPPPNEAMAIYYRHKLQAMGLCLYDPFASLFHASCMEFVKHFREHRQPLVKNGQLLSDRERELIWKYRHELRIHDGDEITDGNWMAVKRLERIQENTHNYIIEQRKIGNLSIFREDRR